MGNAARSGARMRVRGARCVKEEQAGTWRPNEARRTYSPRDSELNERRQGAGLGGLGQSKSRIAGMNLDSGIRPAANGMSGEVSGIG